MKELEWGRFQVNMDSLKAESTLFLCVRPGGPSQPLSDSEQPRSVTGTVGAGIDEELGLSPSKFGPRVGPSSGVFGCIKCNKPTFMWQVTQGENPAFAGSLPDCKCGFSLGVNPLKC